jgi:RNA recognition motif-containing protein
LSFQGHLFIEIPKVMGGNWASRFLHKFYCIYGCADERVFMSKKVFVGGLSWNTENDSLREAFETFGEVTESRVITDRDTGRSRGFGFITFESAESASRAISEMDGTELDGRTIKVNEAQDKPRDNNRGGGGGGRW